MTAREKRAACETRTAATCGCVTDQKGAMGRLERLSGSRSAERRKGWMAVHGHSE